MSDMYQGDPKLTLDENGADLTFKGGQPVMDQGLENAVLISLFSRKGWTGNVLVSDPNQKVGSDFEEKVNQSITISVLNDIRQAGIRALQWMIDSGLASNIEIEVTNPTAKNLRVVILIQPPGQDIKVLLLTKHGLNWLAQSLDPANLKV